VDRPGLWPRWLPSHLQVPPDPLNQSRLAVLSLPWVPEDRLRLWLPSHLRIPQDLLDRLDQWCLAALNLLWVLENRLLRWLPSHLRVRPDPLSQSCLVGLGLP
jgi:hypothetical protein